MTQRRLNAIRFMRRLVGTMKSAGIPLDERRNKIRNRTLMGKRLHPVVGPSYESYILQAARERIAMRHTARDEQQQHQNIADTIRENFREVVSGAFGYGFSEQEIQELLRTAISDHVSLQDVGDDTRFDYDHQVWVVNGRYVQCGHPDAMDCGCYGRIHEGEQAPDVH